MVINCVLYLFLLLNSANSARIFGFFSFPSISHHAFFHAIYRELSLRGHEVIVVTPDPVKDPSLTNLTEIDVHDSYSIFDKYDISLYSREYYHPWTISYKFHEINRVLAEMQLKKKEVQKVFEKGEDYFDLILIEGLYPGLYALTEKFKAPLISLISLAPQNIHLHSMGCPTHHVLSAELFSELGPKMTFFQRLDSFIVSLFQYLNFKYWILPEANVLLKEYFGNQVKDVEEYVKNASLLFVNVNPVFSLRRPCTPRVIEISQLHIQKKNPLPMDLQKVLDKSKSGVVYLSLGTNVRTMPQQLKEEILAGVSNLPFTVLLKWYEDVEVSKNVIVRKWFPQKDLFGHENLKVFVTQGGSQSGEEAVVNGVPMVIIPFLGDQFANAQILAAREVALVLERKGLTRDKLRNAIMEVADNIRYKNKVKQYQKLGSDQPMSGLETAVWWCEHVIRNKGAEYLKSPSGDIPLYQYYFIDILAFFATILFLIWQFLTLTISFFKKLNKSNRMKKEE